MIIMQLRLPLVHYWEPKHPRALREDASINIIELAQSRTTREEVAAIRDSSMGK